jgi:DNA invertase Pin-like site-specific DNA recombinase
VHKVDRLARNRSDDVAIGLAIHHAGAVLVSATESIDDSPAGTLLHGIMAAISEFYSKNLSTEAKKGMQQKVRCGGTPGYVQLGYVNGRRRIEGREVKTIEVDEERAEHGEWAFSNFASGEWSITTITDELERRGMTTRPTATRQAKPLSRSQVHRMLTSPYYLGHIWGGSSSKVSSIQATISHLWISIFGKWCKTCWKAVAGPAVAPGGMTTTSRARCSALAVARVWRQLLAR